MFSNFLIPLIVFFLCVLEIKHYTEDTARNEIYKYRIDQLENKLNKHIQNETSTN